jgi:hypothetical protein
MHATEYLLMNFCGTCATKNIYEQHNECDIKPLGKWFYKHMNTELRVGMLVIVEYIKYSDMKINMKYWRRKFDI